MQSDLFPLGILIGGADLDEALARAAGDGAEIVQIWCTSSDLGPDGYQPAVATRVLRRCGRLGLRISALCGDTGLGFTNPQTVEQALALTSGYLKVCQHLGVAVLTSHVGHFTDPAHPSGRATALEALKRLGDEAARRGVTFANETGAEDGPALREFLDDLGHSNIRVNLDPANMLMRGFCLETAVRLLAPLSVHSHAKDAASQGGEMPIGAGDVPWPQYLGWLRDAGYTGPLVIEREGGNAWRDDCRQGLVLLRKWRGELLGGATMDVPF